MPADPYEDAERLTFDWTSADWRLKRAAYTLWVDNHIAFSRYRKSNVLKHLEFLLLHLVRMERYASGFYTRYSRDNNHSWRTERSNLQAISTRSLKNVIDILGNAGLLELRMGVNGTIGERRSSRMKGTAQLLSYMQELNFLDLPTMRILPENGIVLRDEHRMPVSYEVDDSIAAMSEKLTLYNQRIAQHSIAIDGEVERPIFFDATSSFRVFNRSFDKGGRFYGPWWQRCKKEERERITIDGELVVELDYKANHLCLLYGLTETEMTEECRDEPYNIGHDIPREVVKSCFVVGLNCSSALQAWHRLNQDWAESSSEQRARNEEYFRTKEGYDRIIALLIQKHPCLAGQFHRGIGLQLMNLDAKIAEQVLYGFAIQERACLGVHDSFIVQIQDEQRLHDLMVEAYNLHGIRGITPPITRRSRYDPDLPLERAVRID